MYKVLQSTDWSFLVGGEVHQVAIGLHQVQVAVFEDITTSIECDFAHERSGHVLSSSTEMHTKAATLVSLLGKTVESVTPKGEEALILQFSGDERLTLIVGPAEEPYESFNVSRPGDIIVV
ncbi:MAG TPA: hypothetical protein VMI56_12825 [Reyranella sp.]|nr:hypothetical protein [Reyranella sp.]